MFGIREVKQKAIKSRQLETDHTSFDIRDEKHTGNIMSWRLMIVHISFDIGDGKQTGNQELPSSDCLHFF
jgi:hypothetical protein